MTAQRPWGVRLARWWVAAYTATAPPTEAADRRDEIESDLAEELAAARGETAGVSVRIAGRVLRGAFADVAWRLSVERAPGRAGWHLAHPATVLGVLGAVLVPLTVLGDVLRRPATPGGDEFLGAVQVAVVVVGAAVVAIASATVLRRALGGRPATAVTGRSLLGSVRRWSRLGMCVTWALAAVWRFGAGGLGLVSAVAWGAFGLLLVTWTTLAAVQGLLRVVRRESPAP